MKKNIIYAMCGTVLLMTACDTNKKWEIKGAIENADNMEILVQASENGRWFTIDTITTKSDGKFSYRHDAATYPDIYRLSLDGKNIYFPIDSVNSLTINSSVAGFGSEYTLAGSPSADMMVEADKILRNAGSAGELDSISKRELSKMIVSDPTNIVSYYIINKQLNSKPVFDPRNKADHRMIGAVANAFDQNRPNDPRTGYLRHMYLNFRQRIAPSDTIHAMEMGYFDIDLTDNKGARHLLSSAVDNNKVVVLNFTNYAAEKSPAVNVALANAYQKYHDKGLEIYQVAFDNDEYQWRQSAKNLPWITVYDPATQQATVINQYNIVGLPTTFIIANGTLVKRVLDLSKLDSDIAPYL